jgi:HD-GYP domain-containing protein (c-di-GMP phosphodiesterase class II)
MRKDAQNAEEILVAPDADPQAPPPEPLEPTPADFETANVVVQALARTFELRDYRRGKFAETRDHTENVTKLALALAETVAPHLLDDARFEYGCRLHDIGMLVVSDVVLLKRTALTRAELDEIREHPWVGERIVASVPGLSDIARQVVGGHHERWDGTGYPRGQHGETIPLPARVFAVADAFDAMTREQPWRAALPVDMALEELSRAAGTHFEPEIVGAFLEERHQTVHPAAAQV